MNTRLFQLSTKTYKTSNLTAVNAIFQNDDRIGMVYAVLTNPYEDIVLLSVSWSVVSFYKDYTTYNNPRNNNTFTSNEKSMVDELSELLSINITKAIYE